MGLPRPRQGARVPRVQLVLAAVFRAGAQQPPSAVMAEDGAVERGKIFDEGSSTLPEVGKFYRTVEIDTSLLGAFRNAENGALGGEEERIGAVRAGLKHLDPPSTITVRCSRDPRDP